MEVNSKTMLIPHLLTQLTLGQHKGYLSLLFVYMVHSGALTTGGHLKVKN